MALTNFRLGWNPWNGDGLGGLAALWTLSDALLLDADEEESQFIGQIEWSDHGSHTFGTSGSSIAWLPGASITFQAVATLTVGLKKASTIDAANGPPGRATIGAAAFDVYVPLVAGVATISTTTWRVDAMTLGTPFTLANGDQVAVCHHLDITSAAQSIKVRQAAAAPNSVQLFPCPTLVTSGPTYTAQGVMPNYIITADDGTIGWLHRSSVASVTSTVTVGNTNLYGNMVTPAVTIKVDAVAGIITTSSTTAYDFGFYSTPSGTPAAVANGTVSVNPRNCTTTSARTGYFLLPAEITLTGSTSYALAVKQNSATAVTLQTQDSNLTTDLRANGLDENYFAILSTAGAAFATQNSGKRRAALWFRVSSIDNGAGGAAGMLYTPNLEGI